MRLFVAALLVCGIEAPAIADVDSLPTGMDGAVLMDTWVEVEVTRDGDAYTFHQAVTKIRAINTQEYPLAPALAIELDIPVGVSNCPNDNIAYIATGDGNPSNLSDEEHAFQMMNNAQMAFLAGRPVAVVVNRRATIDNINGCPWARIYRLKALKPEE